MSTKDLFNKGYSLKFLKNKTRNDLREDLESHRFVDAYASRRARFLPGLNFTTASNFARFGLAEEYYETSIRRIYETYPYDGSSAERIEWENDSTYLDLFIFENEYPRTNGFVTFNSSSHSTIGTVTNNVYSSSLPEYISFFGGPHVDPRGDYKSEPSAGPSKSGASKANIFDTSTRRSNNLEIDPSFGNTVEFWMKKDGWVSTGATRHETIFHTAPVNGTGSSYGEYRLYVAGTSNSSVFLQISSGTTDITNTFDTGLDNIADGKWHHYAITSKTNNSQTELNFYVDGLHKSKVFNSSTIDTITGSMAGAVGALATKLSGAASIGYAAAGWGNITSASFDEFRFWKKQRDAQQIGRNWRTQVLGGTNTDNVKYDDEQNFVDLGVYYKFNNYKSATSRNTGSAIVNSGLESAEFKDPIIYDFHPDVSSLLQTKKLEGQQYDHQNPASIYRSLPGWIAEEDEEKSKHLKYLTQIIASFFDDIYLQMEALPKLKNINYPDDNLYEKPLPFADRLLDHRGFDPPELFAHASALAKYLERDEKRLFEKKLYEVKNIIYQNIYNNLSHIQKTKGTFKSLRNFLRCFGVDEELVKLNIYANNDEYEFKDNFTNTSVRKRYLDFDDAETRLTSSGVYTDSYTATAYQVTSSTDSNSLSYIPAITATQMSGAAFTLEAEVFFPKRDIIGDKNYLLYDSSEVSLFGLEAVNASNTDYTYASDNTINFNIIATKPDHDKRNVKFKIATAGGSAILDNLVNDNSYRAVYDNEKWNLAFRLRPTKKNLANLVDESLLPASTAYTYELYGVNYVSNIQQEEFTLSGTMSLAEAAKFFTSNKRVFAGAKRTNFTGSVERKSDVKVSSVRFWFDYLENDAIRAHGKDATSFGPLNPYRNSNFAINNDGLFDKKIPQIDTLVFHWSLDNVTGSDASGQMFIHDTTSGSASDVANKRYGWFSDVSKRSYPAQGDFFVSTEGHRDQAIDVEFVQTAKQKLPEVVNSDDMVKVLNKQDDVVFTRDTTYVQHLLSVEKSMYQIISEQMLRMFATMIEFNDIVGEAANRYRPQYKALSKLRNLFFEKVENQPDLEKFIEYFKWIDDAIGAMITQLIPASSNTVELLRNMVESHILERNKYWSKLPTIENKVPEPTLSTHGIEELKYNWRLGHAPVSPDQNTNQNTNCLWWKQRAERSGILKSGVSGVDADKDIILKTYVTEISSSSATLKKSDGTKYQESYYSNRSLRRLIDLETNRSIKLKGGGNSQLTNKHDFYKNVIKWASDDDFIFLDVDNEIQKTDCDDKVIPDEINKKRFNINALTMLAGETVDSKADGSGLNDQKATDGKGSRLLPFSIFSSSVDTGYQKAYSSQFKIDFTNIHEDKYGLDAEVPLQGPFSRKYVGGMQHRHVKLNPGSDTQLTRPEGWHLQQFLKTSQPLAIINEDFSGASTTATTDVTILSLPAGSTSPEPSEYEYWLNGTTGENSWTFFEGDTPSAGTGPSSGKYAYCEVLPSKVGQTFDLITPLIDLLHNESSAFLRFKYHMFGLGMGNLKVQVSRDRTFASDITDIFTLAGQQHTSAGQAFTQTSYISLAAFLGQRIYIRFLYTAGITHLGDIAIDNIEVYDPFTGTHSRDSFKLMHPTHDDHNRPYATMMRTEFAKRPVNIKNIHMTGTSPTQAGNFLDRYEYVNTVSPEANDPWFVKNVDQIQSTTPELVRQGARIKDVLGLAPGTIRTLVGYKDFTLPDRSFISGSVKNRTRIRTRFSSPGGFETLSRGFLDPAHETYSAYNEINFRNLSSRTVLNTQLQAHQGKFGVSSHTNGIAATVRVVVADGDAAIGMTEQKHITLTSTDGTTKRYVITDSNSDGDTATGTILSDADNTDTGTSTAGPTEDGAIAISLDLSGGRQNNFLVEFKKAVEHSNGHAGKIKVSSVPALADGAQFVLLTQAVVGKKGNTAITVNIPNVTVTNSNLFTGGTNPTARVFGVEARGTINSNNYLLTGDASRHKYHRNNIERIEFIGDDPLSLAATFVTASSFDNAFISHMIPRTDQQTRWITASII